MPAIKALGSFPCRLGATTAGSWCVACMTEADEVVFVLEKVNGRFHQYDHETPNQAPHLIHSPFDSFSKRAMMATCSRPAVDRQTSGLYELRNLTKRYCHLGDNFIHTMYVIGISAGPASAVHRSPGSIKRDRLTQ
jgi:hypothetical protein